MDKLPYLKYDYTTPIRRDWLLSNTTLGCTPVMREGFGLCMDKSPPALPAAAPAKAPTPMAPTASAQTTSPSKPSAPPEPTPPAKDNATRFLEWMIERSEKKQASATSAQERPLPKPFDLYDIPSAMRAQGFAVAALLAQKWLDGRIYNAFGTDTPGHNQELRYPKDRVDTSTVTLKWLLGHRQIRQRFEALLKPEHLSSHRAIDEIQKKFAKYLSTTSPRIHELNTLEHCQGDWQTLHAQFQFQLENVSMADTLSDKLGMSDVTAALANFAFYASVARAQVHTTVYNRYNTPSGTQHCQKSTVKVTHIYAYAKDSYSFHDEGKSSQYLGHWNKNGVIVLPAAVVASLGMAKIGNHAKNPVEDRYLQQAIEWLNSQRIELGNDELTRYPMDIGQSLSDKEVYYPVRNRDYQNWRQLKQRGGDFLIFSDAQRIKLDQPIVLDMPEVCR